MKNIITTDADVLAAIKAKRAEWEKAQAKFARECGAKTAEEWTRADFACFIKRAPELAKLTDNELRALFLKNHGHEGNNLLYTRVTNLYNWRRGKKYNVPNYEIALNGLTGEARKNESKKINDIWQNL